MATTTKTGASKGATANKNATKKATGKSAGSNANSNGSNGADSSSKSKTGGSNGNNGSANGRNGSSAAKSGGKSGAGAGNSQLETYFHDALKDIYWAEKNLTKALPKMMKAATTEELKSAIEEHIAQTEEHVSRLEEVFEIMGKKPQAKKCEAMEGLIKEGESIVEDTEDGSMTRDVGIIMAAQKVEHYEIATYGGLVQLAKTLGMEDAAGILAQTLEEEKQTDEGLTQIAENDINWEAEQEG
ncbi:MAG: ferritin-like protein [Ferruginibacter sp.]|nr:ferritin-like protein [Ferruginibacter sp.]